MIFDDIWCLMIVNEIWWFDDSWRATECASKIFRASSSSLLGHRSAELAWLFLRQASTLTPLTQHPPSQPCQRMSDECWPPWRHPEAPKCCAQPPQSDQIREADGQKKGHRDLIRALRALRALRASSFKAAVSASESQQKMDCSPGRIPDLSKQPALSNSAASMCLPSSSWLKYFWQAELKAASQLTLPKVSKSNTPWFEPSMIRSFRT